MPDPYRLLSLPLGKLCTTGDTNARHALNQQAIAEYTEAARGGADFPPGDAFWDGSCYWLAGGFHRHEAFRRAGRKQMLVRVRDGDRRAAVLFSAGDNKLHGVRLTNEDKRKAVLILLCDRECAAWHDRAIAAHCGVTHPFVGGLREAKAAIDARQAASGNGYHQGATPAPRTYRHPTGATTTQFFHELPAPRQLEEIQAERRAAKRSAPGPRDTARALLTQAAGELRSAGLGLLARRADDLAAAVPDGD